MLDPIDDDTCVGYRLSCWRRSLGYSGIASPESVSFRSRFPDADVIVVSPALAFSLIPPSAFLVPR